LSLTVQQQRILMHLFISNFSKHGTEGTVKRALGIRDIVGALYKCMILTYLLGIIQARRKTLSEVT